MMPTTTIRHDRGGDLLGLPYAAAGVQDTVAGPASTCTCPVCGVVLIAYTGGAKAAALLYALHFTKAEADEKRADLVAAYAATLIGLVAAAMVNEPARYAPVTSWSTLHDVCDANEFCIEANDLLGVDDLDASVDLFNEVVDEVEDALWPDELPGDATVAGMAALGDALDRREATRSWCTRCGQPYDHPLAPTCECAGDPPVDQADPDFDRWINRVKHLRHDATGVGR